MFNYCCNDFSCVLSLDGQDIETAVREPGFAEDVADGPKAAGGELGTFEDGGVAACEGVCDGAEAEDVWGVPFHIH